MTCTDIDDEGGRGDGFGDGDGLGDVELGPDGSGAGFVPGYGLGSAEGQGYGYCGGELLSGGGEMDGRCRAHGRGFGAATGVASGSCTWLGAVDLI